MVKGLGVGEDVDLFSERIGISFNLQMCSNNFCPVHNLDAGHFFINALIVREYIITPNHTPRCITLKQLINAILNKTYILLSNSSRKYIRQRLLTNTEYLSTTCDICCDGSSGDGVELALSVGDYRKGEGVDLFFRCQDVDGLAEGGVGAVWEALRKAGSGD